MFPPPEAVTIYLSIELTQFGLAVNYLFVVISGDNACIHYRGDILSSAYDFEVIAARALFSSQLNELVITQLRADINYPAI